MSGTNLLISGSLMYSSPITDDSFRGYLIWFEVKPSAYNPGVMFLGISTVPIVGD